MSIFHWQAFCRSLYASAGGFVLRYQPLASKFVTLKKIHF